MPAIDVKCVPTGVFEIHLFVTPLEPSEEVTEKFSRDCADGKMKGLLLKLDYEGKGFVGVLQSSAYYRGLAETFDLMAQQKQHLMERGWNVVREKIEATASNDGVPLEDSDAARVGSFFESHVSIARADGVSIDNDDVAKLRDISSAFSSKFQTRIPLSYNALKPGQRFLNTRSYGGRSSFAALNDELERAVAATGTLKVLKNIREFIVYDTNKEIDKGWVDAA